MSNQQNPQHQAALAANDANSDSEPFSIREYALASRQKDSTRSWPFHEKYLAIFHSRGLDAVLPPFESHDSALRSLGGLSVLLDSSEANTETLAGSGKLTRQSSVSKPECKSDEAVSEICSQDGVNAQLCNGVVSSAKTRSVKRKWPGGNCKKKKSIIKIMEVAVRGSSQSTLLESRVDEIKKTSYGEQNCESELSEDDQSLKTKPKAADTHMSPSRKTGVSVLKYGPKNHSSRSSRNASHIGRGMKV